MTLSPSRNREDGREWCSASVFCGDEEVGGTDGLACLWGDLTGRREIGSGESGQVERCGQERESWKSGED